MNSVWHMLQLWCLWSTDMNLRVGIQERSLDWETGIIKWKVEVFEKILRDTLEEHRWDFQDYQFLKDGGWQALEGNGETAGNPSALTTIPLLSPHAFPQSPQAPP